MIRVQVGADAGAEFDLLGLELGDEMAGSRVVVDEAAVGDVVRGDVLPLAAAGRHPERLGSLRHGEAGGIDHQQFFLDPDGALCEADGGVPGRGNQAVYMSRYPQLPHGFSTGPTVPLPLVPFRPPRRLPRLLPRCPQGAGPPSSAGDDKRKSRNCWG